MESQLLEGVRTLVTQVDGWHADPNDVWGIPTEFPKLDALTGGMHPGVNLIGGRTHHGKTAIVNQIGFHIAEQRFINQQAGITMMFSPEMTVDSVILRTACIMAGVPTQVIQSGSGHPDEVALVKQAIELIRKMDDNLFFYGGASLDISAVRHQCERMAMMNEPIDAIIVDYLTYLSAGTITGSRDAASYISRSLAEMATELQVPVIVGAQLSREVEKRGFSKDQEERLPQLSDIAESGQIERDASFIGLLHNPPDLAMSLRGMPQPALLLVRKNRATGRLGNVSLVFDNRLGRFVDASLWNAEEVPL